MKRRLTIRVLGELELSADGVSRPLPPSKKTRALLGYLVLNSRPHRRERLCELLWDVADDPRAALRWSLSKLRELVDDDDRPRLVADRESVRLDLDDVWVDAFEARALAPDALQTASTGALERALSLFRGELLEGLELPDFHAYYAFCLSERDVLRSLQKRIVGELLERTGGRPETALPLARRLVELDPESESARAGFLQLLHASGRTREAAAESRKSTRLLERVRPSTAPARDVATETVDRARTSRLPAARPGAPSPLVGRVDELERLRAALAQARAGARLVLISGDAGVGKSRLLQQLVREEAAEAPPLHQGAAYEVDAGFSYAPFRSLLQRSGALDDDDARFTTVSGADALALARERLFRTVTQWMAGALERAAETALITLEDLHWFDEGSALLLYHLLRAFPRTALCIVVTARAGELTDNAPVRRVLRTLRSEGLLDELHLGPLSRAEIAALVEQLNTGVAPDRVFAESGGNPLFALELARASRQRADDAVPQSITRLVRERMESLESEPAELLRWAAVLGAHFQSDALSELLGIDASALVDGLEQLERLGWLCLSLGDTARFSHDIVHRAIYDGLSDPRRRLMHARVARTLAKRELTSGPSAADLARHAALGGDAEMAVHACIRAARRSLQLFAVSDALLLARRGLSHVAELPLPERVRLEIELLELALTARRPEPESASVARLAELATEALSLSEIDHARRCFYLQAFARWEAGCVADAQRFTREAERISRLGGPRERLRALGDSALCLCMLECDQTEAEAFILEAETLIAAGEPEIANIPVSRGLLALWRGEFDSAAAAFERALVLARADGERLAEFSALEGAIEVALARGEWERAAPLSAALMAHGARTHEGSEGPFANAVGALIDCALGRGTNEAVEQALAALRLADAKRRSAYVLVRWAELAHARGEHAVAQKAAEEACRLADQMANITEGTLSRAVLLELAGTAASATEREALRAQLSKPLSARARAAIARALAHTSTDPHPRGRKESHGTRDRRARLRRAGESGRTREED